MAPKPRFLPYLALAAGILALSLSSIFIRWAQAPGPVTSFYRMAIATLALAPFFFRRASRLQAVGWRLLLVPVLGGIFTTFDHSLWSTAINMTSVANATLMNNTAPIWVALVAWLVFHERLRPVFWLGLALSLAGATLVLGDNLLHHPALSRGDLLAVISGLFYAAYFLTTQRGRRSLDTLSYVWIVTLSASLGLFAVTRIASMPVTGFSPQTYLAFLGAGLISQVVGYFSVGYALGHLPASLVAPTMIAQPVLTALLAIPLVGEPLQTGTWLGGLITLGGIYLLNRSREPAAGREEASQAALSTPAHD
jgi:drug/metabolite transporter (DMT)-like permease